MTNNNCLVIGFKRSDDGSGYNFKYLQDKVPSFVKLVFRNVSSNEVPWKQVDGMSIDSIHRLQIIVHNPEDLFVKGKTSDIIPLGQDQSDSKIPILHIVVAGIFNYNLYGNSPLPFILPRYYQYMDNSIWNYYVPMAVFEESKPDCFQSLFNQAVEKIYDNYENKIYELPVAEEYADLNARILQQSYLPSDRGKGHAKYVSPFIFHSETAIERMIEKNCKKLKGAYGKDKDGKFRNPWRWRFLLVDDKAIELKNGSPASNCKMSIVKRLIERALFNGRKDKEVCVQYREYKKGQFGKKNINGEIDLIDKETLSKAIIVIDCVTSLDDAVTVLKKYKYDLVLLDYLLDGGANRNYGYELLEEIDKVEILFEQFNDFRLVEIDKEKTILEQLESLDNKEDFKDLISFINENNLGNENKIDSVKDTLEKKRFKIGPHGKLFFIFISAYMTAVNERLLAQALSRSEKYWYIDIGGCPTNTPMLFTYNLLQLMEKRLNDSGIWRLTSEEIIKFIIEIFIPNNNKSVRERARDNYHFLLSRHYHFHSLLRDVEVPEDYNKNRGDIFKIEESVLVSDFILKKHNLGGLLEHMIQLVHLTAFGTIRQWAEMWEEYIYIKAHFEKWERNVSDSVEFKRACSYIEKYIYDLKSQQR